jgi:putative tryptophan/tyrosine transport system substrate-binding protein
MKFPLVFSVAVLISLFTACHPAPKKITIGYVQITQDPVLDVAKAGVFRALADSGFVNGENIKILDNNAQGDLSMINTILQTFLAQNVDLVITNSTPCMAASAQTIRKIPVVFTVAFSPEQIGMKTVPENLFGIFDPLSTEEFADVVMECIPGLKRIGIPYNNVEPNAEYSVKVLSKEFEARGIQLVTAPVTSTNDLIQAGEYLAGQHIDAMVAAADNTVYLGLPVLAKLASEKNIPLFVTDPMQTEKGASVGFGVDYDQWGYLAGLKAVEILKGRTLSLKHIEPILKNDLIINRKASDEQGLNLTDKVIGNATRIIE